MESTLEYATTLSAYDTLSMIAGSQSESSIPIMAGILMCHRGKVFSGLLIIVLIVLIICIRLIDKATSIKSISAP